MKKLLITIVFLLITINLFSQQNSDNESGFSIGLNIGTTERGYAPNLVLSYQFANKFNISSSFTYLDAVRKYDLPGGSEFDNEFDTFIYDLTISKKIGGFNFGIGYSYAQENIEFENFSIGNNDIRLNDKNMNGVHLKLAYIFSINKYFDFNIIFNNYYFDNSEFRKYKIVLGIGLVYNL